MSPYPQSSPAGETDVPPVTHDPLNYIESTTENLEKVVDMLKKYVATKRNPPIKEDRQKEIM